GMAGLATHAILAHRTLLAVEVNGPHYRQIMMDKDLVADILPPPEFLVESYLSCLRLVDERDPMRADALTAKLGALRHEYDDRHRFWDRTLAPGPIRSALVDESHASATEFLRLEVEEFLPAIR